MRRSVIGVLVGIILLGCLLSPFVESAMHSDGTILSGQDNESTVALLALCIAFAVAVASFVSTYGGGLFSEVLLLPNACRASASNVCIPCLDSDTSPPLTALRI